ncbi:retinitis pigmentosa GTPase regulator b isoform X1 [Brachyhypopomus gauderio]|uniref:retinitis pigmentosa GTPase regulator b isoform X1 n=1 Tax=Brachyhypopomus gauderio TaxID=698409 RepID=UPI004041BF29
MAGESEDDIPESGAVFTFGKSKFADNIPSKFWLKNDVPLTVACGDEHTALITENGKLFMFGSNNWGQLGLGSKNSVNKPTCVKALKSEKVMLVACGRTHTLVYTSCGNLYGAGGNNDGQLGLGDCEERTSFQLIDFFTKKGPIKMLSAGSNTSAALLQDGRLFMWGDNSEGQIGLGEEDCAWTPQELPAQNRVNWVSCGYYHSAFVTVDGALFTFGEKDSGKLGLSAEQLTNHRVPQQVAGMSEHVLQVACGGGHTVVLTDDCLYTFGLGQYGQLGHGTFIFESRSPRLVEHFSKGRVKHIVCGENHTAVVTESGLLYTFGDGRHGKLGLGEENFTNQFQPTLCPRLLIYHVQSVTCGGCHMVVLAKPRVEGSNDIILEEGDIRENYMETARPFGETGGPLTLSRSLSARVRRRERECSEQFGMMFQTLPPLSSGYLRESLPVSSHTLPPRLQSKRAPSGLEENGFTNRRDMMIKDKVDGKSVPDENSGDSESVKGLGETTDLLNLTHVMKVDPGDKTLTLSPVHKKTVKVVKRHGKVVGQPTPGPACSDWQAGRISSKAPPSQGGACEKRKALITLKEDKPAKPKTVNSSGSERGTQMPGMTDFSRAGSTPPSHVHAARPSQLMTDNWSKPQSDIIEQRRKSQLIQEDLSESGTTPKACSGQQRDREEKENLVMRKAEGNHLKQASVKSKVLGGKQTPLEIPAKATHMKHTPVHSESNVKKQRRLVEVQSQSHHSTAEPHTQSRSGHGKKGRDVRIRSREVAEVHTPSKETTSTVPASNPVFSEANTRKQKTPRAPSNVRLTDPGSGENTADRAISGSGAQNSLLGVSSLTGELENPVCLLTEATTRHFLAQAGSSSNMAPHARPSRPSPNTPGGRTLSDASSISDEPRHRKAVPVVLEPGGSDKDGERNTSQYQSGMDSSSNFSEKGGHGRKDAGEERGEESDQSSQEEVEQEESRGMTGSEGLMRGAEGSSSTGGEGEGEGEGEGLSSQEELSEGEEERSKTETEEEDEEEDGSRDRGGKDMSDTSGEYEDEEESEEESRRSDVEEGESVKESDTEMDSKSSQSGEAESEEEESEEEESEEEESEEEESEEEESEESSESEDSSEVESGEEEEESGEEEVSEEEDDETEDEEEGSEGSSDKEEDEGNSAEEEEEEEESRGCDEESGQEEDEESKEEEEEEEEEHEQDKEEEEEDEQSSGDNEAEEAEEEEEEEECKKKRRQNGRMASSSIRRREGQRAGRHRQGSARKGQSHSKSQKPRQFWDDVLPHYLNLK